MRQLKAERPLVGTGMTTDAARECIDTAASLPVRGGIGRAFGQNRPDGANLPTDTDWCAVTLAAGLDASAPSFTFKRSAS